MFSKKLFLILPIFLVGSVIGLSTNKYEATLAAATNKDRYQLRASTATLTWGIWDFGSGLAGFESGNIAEASDTLQSFNAPTEGDYKAVFHYYAGSYPNATAPKRLLNFIVNGRQNIKGLTIDPDFNWGVEHTEEFSLHLDCGTNTIVLQGEHGPDSCVNADKLEIFDLSNNLVATLEAEDGILNNTGIPAPGIVAGFENRNRPSIDVAINVSKAGLYTLGLNYAGGPNGTAPDIRSLNIGVNAEGKSGAYTKVDFNATGDWGVYALGEFDIQLKEGSNIITIQSYPGVDSLQSSLNLSDLYVSLSGYQQALDFSNDYLFMNTVPTTDHSSTENCAKNYNAAIEAFNDLSDEGKSSFLEHDDFKDARERFAAWAKANGQTFDPSLGLFISDSLEGVYNIQSNTNNLTIILVFSCSALLLLITCVYSKKKHNKNN